MHSGNLGILTDEWGPAQEPEVPDSSPALFGDLDPRDLSPVMKIFCLQNWEDSIIHSTDFFGHYRKPGACCMGHLVQIMYERPNSFQGCTALCAEGYS